MNRFVVILCACLVLVMGISYAVTFFVNDPAGSEIIYTVTTSQNKEVQQKLKELGYYKGIADGILGTQSVTAIKNFQKDNGLIADGLVGGKTLAKLGLNAANTDAAGQNDVYLLAKCVFAEARGEPYAGQVAVAAVILNRVKDPRFPNTISGVIYQPLAFAWVTGGHINLQPDESAYNAAKDALNGWDPTYGSTCYYNPNTATDKQMLDKPITAKIGRHVFVM